MWDSSCSRNSKNYIPDVTFNYFHSDSWKVPRIKAGVLTVEIQHRTTREQLMYNAQLFVVLSARRFIVEASPELKFHTTDGADTALVVSGLAAARKLWYIFSPDFVQIATFLACSASARHCLFWINAECICRRRFHYFLSFVLFLSKGASKAKIALINLAINFGYEYFYVVIYFSKIFFVKTFFQHFFPKTFCRNWTYVSCDV